MDAALDAEKATLRSRMRGLRRQLQRDQPQADWQAGEHGPDLLADLFPGVAGVAALYHASGAEMDCGCLAEVLVRRGWRLALPMCRAPARPVSFHLWTSGDPMTADAVGILSPLPEAPEVEPDLIIAPVLAFDPGGGRLGQGGGYYDRTLGALRAAGWSGPFVGLAYAGQEAGHIPMGPLDQRLDAILTEKGYRRLG